ncbi:MAG: AAA family ATPase [Candidatus Obscuribacterales bacterium]|nr:AAA family ATPase [Candidatus Obscuribacterales bacterium]
MLKPWAKWTVLIAWTLILLMTSAMWNPFTSFQALLKYTVVSVVASAIFGALVILIQWYLLLAIIFPLPPRADAKAPKSFWRKFFGWAFKDSKINPKAPTQLSELIGNVQAKIEIREVIDMISHPQQYTSSGAEVPKGLLFVGPPGTGKTLFARAIANEVGIPFYVVEGSSLSGLIMGLGVLKLKTLFKKLRKHEKAILFIDEIDSIGSKRQGDKGFGGVADMNMTLNTLLTEMDGFKSSNVIVIGATNNDGILDPALMRAGRMDRKIYFQLPTPEERQEIFRYYLGKVSCGTDIDYEELGKLTQSFSPAEIATVVNEAALICRRPGGPGVVTMDTLEQALDRSQVGVEKTLVGSGIEVGNTDSSIRLADVIGIDDVKQDIFEIIDFLKHGDDLRKIGAKIPKGVLLIGPPGVGKTMLAKAMANEANVPFFGMSASYFVSMFAGEGAGRIRALYSQARKSPAAIIFIDEIDAISGTMSESGNNRTSTLNQLLIELDGLARSNVITIGATNNESNLDPAFMRSGRFDRKAYVGLPDAEARKKIFEKYLSTIKMASEPALDKLAQQTTNFSGADIAATVNEAAIMAVRNGKTHVEEVELEAAVDRISVTAGHKLNTYGMNLARVPDLEVKLDDIKGMEEAKNEAAEVVALLKNTDKIRSTGLKAPKGVLLVGPPGTGKTMLAKAIANEAGVPFYALSGGDFQSMWAGVGANRVRAVYEQARRSGKPAIVFIDEIDALAGKRGIDLGGGAIQDSNKTLNQFLVELDGFGKHKVLTIGATNHPDLLDPALLRPGRFDRRIEVPRPNLEGREAILQYYLKKTKIEGSVNPLEIARMTVWKSGADLANIVNEAGLIAIRTGRDAITQLDLVQAIQRQSFGMSYSRQVVLEELRATAYHEAGHAIVAYFRDKHSRIQIVTIVPSGYALGYVWPVEKEERNDKFKHDMMVDIEIYLGSLVSERMFFGQNGRGVSEDLRQAGLIARRMVRLWGMGNYTFNTDAAFGNTEDSQGSSASMETERELELQTKAIIDECRKNVEELLQTRKAQIERLAEALVEKETLYYRDVVNILEPERTDADIQRELAEIAERKLVGKNHHLELNGILGLGGNVGAPKKSESAE